MNPTTYTKLAVTDKVKVTHSGHTFRAEITSIYEDCSLDLKVLNKMSGPAPEAKAEGTTAPAPEEVTRGKGKGKKAKGHKNAEADVEEAPINEADLLETLPHVSSPVLKDEKGKLKTDEPYWFLNDTDETVVLDESLANTVVKVTTGNIDTQNKLKL